MPTLTYFLSPFCSPSFLKVTWRPTCFKWDKMLFPNFFNAFLIHPHLSNGLSWLITLSVCKCVFFKQKHEGAGQTYPASTSSSDCQENKQSMECYGIQGIVGSQKDRKKRHILAVDLSLSLSEKWWIWTGVSKACRNCYPSGGQSIDFLGMMSCHDSSSSQKSVVKL